MPEIDEASHPFSRPTPVWVRLLAFVLAAAPCVLTPMMISVVADVAFRRAKYQALHDMVGSLPLGTPALVGSLLGLALLPGALLLGLVLWARRRFGEVEVHGDQLTFRFALAPKWFTLTVGADELCGRREVPGGVLLEPARRRLAPWRIPLFVPTQDEAQRERLLAYLDQAPQPAGEGPKRVFGRDPPGWLVLLFVGLDFGLAAPGIAAVIYRSQSEDAVVLWGSVYLLSMIVPLSLLDAHALQPRYRRLHAGEAAVIVTNLLLPYAELTRLAVTGPYLVLESGRRRRIVWLGPELDEVVQILRERLATRSPPLEVATVPPAWAQPEARRRRTLLLTALLIATPALQLALAFALY